MTGRIKRAICMATAAVLLTGSLASPASARATRRFSAWPEEIPQGVRTVWRHLDPETLAKDGEAMMETLLLEAEKGADAEALFQQCTAVAGRLEALGTYYSFLNWDYHREPQHYGGDVAEWSAMLYSLQSKWGETLRKLLTMETGEELYLLLNEKAPTLLYTSSSLSEEQMELLAEIQELVTDCDLKLLALSGQGVFSGTMDGSASGSSAHEAFEALGEQYLALAERRNRLAETMGFDNWLSYCYAMEYGREYTPEEAYDYCLRVPAAVNKVYSQIGFVSAQNGLEDVFYFTGQELEDTSTIAPFLEEVSSELSDLLVYAEENDLLDTEPLSTKLSGAYTAPLPAFDSAYMCLSPGYLQKDTLVHEFGHFAKYCLAPSLYDCMDVSELHSQGLEMLYLAYEMEQMETPDPSFPAGKLMSTLGNALQHGAILSTIEYLAYTSEEPVTVETLSAAYADSWQALGVELSEGAERDWLLIPHLYEMPGYYVSYVVSAANALELLVLAGEDFTDAADRYLSLLAQEDVYGYESAVTAAGLTDLMEEGALETILSALSDYVYEEVFLTPSYSDVPRERWSYDSVMMASACGLMAGQEGRFSPDKPLAAGELNAMTERLTGSPAAADAGGTVRRQDLARILFDWAEEQGIDTSARAELAAFSDAGDIDSAALDAVSWAAAVGLLKGDGGKLLPGKAVTREQAAAILIRFATL